MKADETTLMRLAMLAQNGDRTAYRTLLVECQRWLGHYFYRKVPPAAMEDLIQETLATLHVKLASFDPSRPFLNWLAAIARYRWVDHLRTVYRLENRANLADADGSVDGEAAMVARISLERLLTHVSPAQARAIELVKIEGLSIAEASARTGQSETLIKVNIHRGLRRLAANIEQV